MLWILKRGPGVISQRAPTVVVDGFAGQSAWPIRQLTRFGSFTRPEMSQRALSSLRIQEARQQARARCCAIRAFDMADDTDSAEKPGRPGQALSCRRVRSTRAQHWSVTSMPSLAAPRRGAGAALSVLICSSTASAIVREYGWRVGFLWRTLRLGFRVRPQCFHPLRRIDSSNRRRTLISIERYDESGQYSCYSTLRYAGFACCRRALPKPTRQTGAVKKACKGQTSQGLPSAQRGLRTAE